MKKYIKPVILFLAVVAISLIGGSSSNSKCAHDDFFNPADFFQDMFSCGKKNNTGPVVEIESHSFEGDDDLPLDEIFSKEKTSSRSSKDFITLVEFGSVNCAPCRQMLPVLELLRIKYPHEIKIIHYDVSIQEGKSYADAYKIKALPTFIFYNAEKKEYSRHEGLLNMHQIEKILKRGGLKQADIRL